jgi:cold shock protein
MTSTITKKFDNGFGFIQTDKGEIFFHANYCNTPFEVLAVGDIVSYREGVNSKGPTAIDVEKTR